MNNKQTANALTGEFYDRRIADGEKALTDAYVEVRTTADHLETAMSGITYKGQQKAVRDAVAEHIQAIEKRADARESLTLRRHDRDRFLAESEKWDS